MGIIIILIAVLVIGIALTLLNVYKWKTDIWSALGFVVATVDIISLSFVGGALATNNSNFARIEAEYNNLKAQTEYVDFDYSLSDGNLRNQVLDMNNTISKHKVYSQNWFIGVFYSERIGELEPLTWKAKERCSTTCNK